MKNIIFLDIDGPMIPAVAFLTDPMASDKQLLDSRSVKILSYIIEKSNAEIVFNSYHNQWLLPEQASYSLTPGLIERFREIGLLESIHSSLSTDYPSVKNRRDAIYKWLKDHSDDGPFRWIALDDSLIEDERACLVDFDNGIGMKEIEHSAKYLDFKMPIILL